MVTFLIGFAGSAVLAFLVALTENNATVLVVAGMTCVSSLLGAHWARSSRNEARNARQDRRLVVTHGENGITISDEDLAEMQGEANRGLFDDTGDRELPEESGAGE